MSPASQTKHAHMDFPFYSMANMYSLHIIPVHEWSKGFKYMLILF